MSLCFHQHGLTVFDTTKGLLLCLLIWQFFNLLVDRKFGIFRFVIIQKFSIICWVFSLINLDPCKTLGSLIFVKATFIWLFSSWLKVILLLSLLSSWTQLRLGFKWPDYVCNNGLCLGCVGRAWICNRYFVTLVGCLPDDKNQALLRWMVHAFLRHVLAVGEENLNSF